MLKCVKQIEISIRLSPSSDCEAHNFLYFAPQVSGVLLNISLPSNRNQFSLRRSQCSKRLIDCIHYPYSQYTNLFVFRFVSLLSCPRRTLRLLYLLYSCRHVIRTFKRKRKSRYSLHSKDIFKPIWLGEKGGKWF